MVLLHMNEILRRGVYPERSRRDTQNDVGQEPVISSEPLSGDREIPRVIRELPPDRLANLPICGLARSASHLVPMDYTQRVTITLPHRYPLYR